MAAHPKIAGLFCLILCGCVPQAPEPSVDPRPAPKKQAEAKPPPLISKLRYLKDESMAWLLVTGFLDQNGAMPFKYEDAQGFKNNTGAAMPVKPGEVFFGDGPAKGRFKYLGPTTRKQINPAINVEEMITYAMVEDLKPNKKGKAYELPAPMRRIDRPKNIHHDRSAVMMLEPMREGDMLMTVEENTRFALPPHAKKKDYLLKSVTPEQIIVEYTCADGQRVEVKIKKGYLPDMKD